MKKTVIIILAILPIFLLITISFAGKILSLYSYIAVENVYFIDENHEKIEDDFQITINKDETHQLFVKVLPELASNKEVSYASSNTDVCTVDENGLITGTGHGSTYVKVITKDSKKSDSIMVFVSDDFVSGVELSHKSLELIVGETRKLNVTVTPSSALNKNVTWTSSDSNVIRVDSNGFITALSVGTVEVFVVTEDGLFTDVCNVTCVDGIPPLAIDFSSSDAITKLSGGYQTSTNEIDLKEFIILDSEKVLYEDVVITIEAGNSYATIDDNGVLKINNSDKVISLYLYVDDKDDPTYCTKVRIIYKK